MDEKLENIFAFLNINRQFNHALQDKFYQAVVIPFVNKKDKIISLLYHIANTQSQPKIDNLANFYRNIHQDPNCFSSFENFIRRVNPNSPINFDSLYKGMKNQDGWGSKTAALFTKSIYHLHNGHYSDKLKIWGDVPSTIADNDNFYLPVDAVIIAIFKKLDNTINWNFDKVNNILKEKYTGQQIEVWDDLWFWGFITQNGSGDNRKFEWNENKYWALKESDKKQEKIKEVKDKSVEFLKAVE
ncbi:MAG: hypothetical protein K2X48_06355 [Chitinophagaceae bacterium]|nr:hypothetical protein [Chitinophagaceae bacterium]